MFVKKKNFKEVITRISLENGIDRESAPRLAYTGLAIYLDYPHIAPP